MNASILETAFSIMKPLSEKLYYSPSILLGNNVRIK